MDSLEIVKESSCLTRLKSNSIIIQDSPRTKKQHLYLCFTYKDPSEAKFTPKKVPLTCEQVQIKT